MTNLAIGAIKMIRIEHSIVINRPIEEVFAFLANPENAPKWDPTIIETKITSEGPIGVGTKGLNVGQILGRRNEFTFEYDVYEPPRKVSGHTTSGPMEVWMSNTFESFEGGTRVTHNLEIKLGSRMKVPEPMVAMAMKRQIKKNFANLKALLEPS